MEVNQVTDPATGNQETAGTAGQGGSVLTSDSPAAIGAPAVGEGVASENPKWMDQLDADLKGEKGLTKFDTVSKLGKSYIELEGKIGKSVTVPDEKASEEDWTKFRKATGVPDKPEDYKLDKVELPFPVDEQRVKDILAVARKNNVPQAAINAIYKSYMTAFGKDVAEAQKIVKITSDEAATKLKAELKGDYDAAMTLKARAFKQLAGDGPDGAELVALLDKTGVGNHPAMVKLFAKIGKAIGDHVFVDGTKGTPEAAPAFGNRSDAQLASALYPDKSK